MSTSERLSGPISMLKNRTLTTSAEHSGQVLHDQPQPDGRTQLRLTPLQLIERLAALIPPPRLHRHRYHRVLD